MIFCRGHLLTVARVCLPQATQVLFLCPGDFLLSLIDWYSFWLCLYLRELMWEKISPKFNLAESTDSEYKMKLWLFMLPTVSSSSVKVHSLCFEAIIYKQNSFDYEGTVRWHWKNTSQRPVSVAKDCLCLARWKTKSTSQPLIKKRLFLVKVPCSFCAAESEKFRNDILTNVIGAESK